LCDCFSERCIILSLCAEFSLATIIQLKALTPGRTDHFITCLQFPINVCFSTAKTELLFPISLSRHSNLKGTFSSCVLDLRPTTLTCELDLFRVKMNHCTRCLRRRSFCSTVIVRTQTQTHTADRLHHLDHRVIDSQLVLVLLQHGC